MVTPEKTLGPDFTKVWSASLLTNLSDGVLKLAAPLLAVTLTQNPILISLLSALALLPWLLFAIPIGAYVDRVDRKKALVQGNLVRSIAGMALSFAIWRDVVSIWVLLVLVFIIGMCEVLVDTTSQSVLPQILDKSHYERGNSRLQISEVIIAQFIGSPLSGFLYAIAIGLPFLFSTAGFTFAAIFLSVITFHKQINVSRIDGENVKTGGLREDIVFAVKFILGHEAIRTIVLITTSIGFFYSFSTAIAPLFILNELNVKPSFFGVIFAVEGVGALLGSALTPRISQRVGRGRALGLSLAFSASTVIGMGVSPNVYAFMGASVLMGFTISIWTILIVSVYQTLIPAHLFGRIHGARRTLVWGLMPIGSILGGIVATLGLRFPFVIGGCIATMIAIASYRLVEQIGNQTMEWSDSH